MNTSLRIGQGHSLLARLYFLLTAPVSIFFILSSTKIDPRYQVSRLTKLRLGLRLLRNTLRIPTGSSFKVHLAMALKLLESPPEMPGAVVECGSWKGGSAANLSLICKLTGRTLEIFDSFAGLPPGEPADREAQHYRPGDYLGTLEEVQENVGRYGALDCCHFNPGWFHETLPNVNYPIVLAFLDVDYEASLDVCVRNLWPHLVEGGYIVVDECATLDYVSLFFSESWWLAAFDQTPPGLIGAGTGLALGEYYIGPWSERTEHPLQHITTGAYTQKGMSAYWAYRPTQTSVPPAG